MCVCVSVGLFAYVWFCVCSGEIRSWDALERVLDHIFKRELRLEIADFSVCPLLSLGFALALTLASTLVLFSLLLVVRLFELFFVFVCVPADCVTALRLPLRVFLRCPMLMLTMTAPVAVACRFFWRLPRTLVPRRG